MSLMFKTCSLLLVQVHLIKLKKKKKNLTHFSQINLETYFAIQI